MALSKLTFTKTWTSSSDFPTRQTSEEQVRSDIQLLHNETKNKINDNVDALESTTDGSSGADCIGVTTISGVSGSTVQSVLESLAAGTSGAGDMKKATYSPSYTGVLASALDLTTHTSNTGIHVSSSDKATWNGKQNTIDSSNKLSADYISDGSTNKTVTSSEKSTWNGKQNAISDLSTIRSGATAGATAVQPATLTDKINRSDEVDAANTSYSTVMARGIYAGTSDMTAGSSALTSGVIYLVYE